MSRIVSLGGALTTLLATVFPAQAAFDITISFGSGLTASQQAIFSQAETFWESTITGYKTGVTLTGLSITASGPAIDGVGGVLGSAGPSTITQKLGTWYTATGVMNFDSADLSNMESAGTLLDVIKHEMAHVIGFGTLWISNSLYVNNSGNFTGANALAAYKTEFSQPSATSVPVELAGGSGTANAHWNENTNGSGNTGIVDSLSRDMKYELMTGWLNSPAFVSNTTIQSFADLGYIVVPEPATATILMVLGAGVLLRRQRSAA